MNYRDIQNNLKNQIIHMLDTILTQAELSALARNKGISVGKSSKMELVALTADEFLKPDHIIGAYEGLSPDYRFLLHYLKATKEPIKFEIALRYLKGYEIALARGYFLGSFEARDYRNLFSQLKNDLAVKGLVVIIEISEQISFKSKFERFHLYLPEEFHPFLPPLSMRGEKTSLKGEGHSLGGFAKNVLLCSLRLRTPSAALEQKIVEDISWTEGFPYFQDVPIFRASDFLKRIYTVWCVSRIQESYPEKVNIVANLLYLFRILPKGEWLPLPYLQELFGRLTRFYKLKEILKILPEVCDEAVRLGFLEKTRGDSADPWYRLQHEALALIDSSENRSDRSDTHEGISVREDGSLLVNLRQVSISSLLEILLLSDWTPSADALHCYPSKLKCGRILREFSDFSGLLIYNYLNQHAVLYQRTLQDIKKDFGKFMVHTDLSIFEITDVTISALLQHTFPMSFYPIGGYFFAVSEDDESQILKFLEQKKYSIKIKE